MSEGSPSSANAPRKRANGEKKGVKKAPKTEVSSATQNSGEPTKPDPSLPVLPRVKSSSQSTDKNLATPLLPEPSTPVAEPTHSPKTTTTTATPATEIIVSKKLTPLPIVDQGPPDVEFEPPPNNQRTFYFPEDDLEFSSEFDSGNLIQAERIGPYRYNFYTSMDCGNCDRQTNNRQWFHFSVRGGGKGISICITFIGVMHSHMFTYDWMPVMAVFPDRPEYQRIPGRATVVSLETMPSTPGYPLLEHKVRGGEDSDAEAPEGTGEENPSCTPTAPDGVLVFAPPKPVKKKKRVKKKKDIAMNLTFEFRMEAAIPIVSSPPLGDPQCPAIYIASNHPYSCDHLRRNLLSWQVSMLRQLSEGKAMKLVEDPRHPYAHNMGLSPTDNVSVYFHREILCLSLEKRPVELLTITNLNGIRYDKRMPMISSHHNIPLSSSPLETENPTERPYYFEGKTYVVLTARVHPGECPGSHMMHGAISFLLNKRDSRAQTLRDKFVFLIVPMINPDGVFRGHSRIDANGIDLNRMYSSPSPKWQPVPFCLRHLLIPLAKKNQLSLFVDMHAHANKKGAFLFGNGLPAEDQIKSLLYAKLVSMNTPYIDYNSCNYSESNMFSVGVSGKSKDSSARIVLFLETGFVFSYAIETSHVCAKVLNTLPRLDSLPGEDVSTDVLSTRFSPSSFGDMGKALLLGLLDLHRCNPHSRIAASTFGSVDSLETYIERQLKVEACEKIFTLLYKDGSRMDSLGPSQNATQHLLVSVHPEEIPDKLTLRGARNLPIVTFSGVREYLPPSVILSVLDQNAPTGPPRSLLLQPRQSHHLSRLRVGVVVSRLYRLGAKEAQFVQEGNVIERGFPA